MTATARLLEKMATFEDFDNHVDVLDALAAGLRPFGIEHVLYMYETVDGTARVCSSGEDWFAKVLPDVDSEPLLKYACKSYEATYTGIAFMDDYPFLEDRERSYIVAAAELGFRSGLGLPVRLTKGDRVACFNLGTALPKASFLATIAPHEDVIRTAALVAHRHINELEESERAGSDVLSTREFEVVRSLAHGNRVAAIASELELSEAAIRLYLRNARKKLNARTPEEAVARAVAMQLVELGPVAAD